MDDSLGGDEIVVGPGTYVESIDLGGKPITLRSADPSDPAVVAATVLTIESERVVRCVSGEGPDTVLAGVTIIGPGVAACCAREAARRSRTVASRTVS